ncbi:MAG: hypothetical protein U0517_02140 [Candidatus Andersenbacteria bacterium]
MFSHTIGQLGFNRLRQLDNFNVSLAAHRSGDQPKKDEPDTRPYALEVVFEHTQGKVLTVAIPGTLPDNWQPDAGLTDSGGFTVMPTKDWLKSVTLGELTYALNKFGQINLEGIRFKNPKDLDWNELINIRVLLPLFDRQRRLRARFFNGFMEVRP